MKRSIGSYFIAKCIERKIQWSAWPEQRPPCSNSPRRNPRAWRWFICSRDTRCTSYGQFHQRFTLAFFCTKARFWCQNFVWKRFAQLCHFWHQNIVDKKQAKNVDEIDTYSDNTIRKNCGWGKNQFSFTFFFALKINFEIFLFRDGVAIWPFWMPNQTNLALFKLFLHFWRFFHFHWNVNCQFWSFSFFLNLATLVLRPLFIRSWMCQRLQKCNADFSKPNFEMLKKSCILLDQFGVTHEKNMLTLEKKTNSTILKNKIKC